ncbi:rh50 [Anaeramoeba flamelloides]|uniref:Rh50 n=1 Tax=Anaeramoeba flamelloides TaxID=1746091 RepID=A0AAV8AHA4_9EUKA|nr:rh50 isoform b [Anaeramoeba flamelloides]KAJ6249284.1 rh50 [Anaeramoeba flamelloides]
MGSTKTNQRNLVIILTLLQTFMLIIAGVWFKYDESLDETKENETDHRSEYYYTYYSDVAVMIIIGFGFLMTFLKYYGKSAAGLTFLLTTFCVQWVMIVNAFFFQAYEEKWESYPVSVETLIEGMFGAGAVMITFGAVLGKTTPLQLILIAFFEIIFYGLNIYLCIHNFKAIDVGGSLIIHTFGAYFGIGLTSVLTSEQETKNSSHETSDKWSDLFSLFGTIFLWLFWPSFNGALAPPGNRFRVIINTVISLCGSAVFSFLLSAIFNKGKFNVVDIQNATLAGGVAVGASADLFVTPVGAMGIGALAGTISTFGFNKISPFLKSRFNIQDTCGVNNLHGLPGLLGGLFGIINAAIAENDHSLYNGAYSQIFPEGKNQVKSQVGAFFTTFAISLLSGILTGVILKFFTRNASKPFSDKEFWVQEEESTELPTFSKFETDQDQIELSERKSQIKLSSQSSNENLNSEKSDDNNSLDNPNLISSGNSD